MRKVIYKEWIPGVETEAAKNATEFSKIIMRPHIRYEKGTNCYIEKEGFFHGFFQSFDYVGPNNEAMSTPIALIECEDGKMLEFNVASIRFIDSLEVTDLEQKRYELSRAAMQGMLAHSTRYKPRVGASQDWHEAMSEEAIQIADAMIAELKKKTL